MTCLFAKSIGDVRHVATGRGVVSLQCLSRQVVGFPATNSGQEVGEMRSLQSLRLTVVRQVFDLLALLIEERAAGSIAGEITALAVNHDATILVSELAHRVCALGGAHVTDLTNEGSWLVIQQRDVRVGSLAAVVECKPAPNAQGARRRLILSQSPAAKVYDMNPIIA